MTELLLFFAIFNRLVSNIQGKFSICTVLHQHANETQMATNENSILAPFDDKAGKLTSAEHNPRAHEAKIRNFFHPSLRGLTDKPTFIFIYL